MRTLIRSDIHLGLPEPFPGRLGRSPATLSPLLEAADRVVLNGDAADTQHPSHRAQGIELLEQLAALATRKGVDLIRISGNHDVEETALTHIELARGKILVTHGHAFSASMLPWVPASGAMNRVFAEALGRNPPTVEGAVRAANDAALVQWSDERSVDEPTALLAIGLRPTRVLSVLAWWRKYPRDAARFAQRYAPSAQFVVCGHSHRAGAWSIATDGGARRWILNTGSFSFPSRPHAVIVTEEDGGAGTSLEMRRIVQRRGGYTLAEESRASSWRIH